MEFDKSKILTVVTADQAKVGQKGWFSSNIENLAYLVREEQPKELLGFNSNNAVHAFRTSFQNHALFYPAPEQTYAERQAQWVKQNTVKEGMRVRVTRTFASREDGCGIPTNASKALIVGDETCTIKKITPTYISVYSTKIDDWWSFPYFVLEVIKEPTYRPYNNDELNDLVGEVLTNKQSGRRKLVTGKPTASEGVNIDGSYITAKDLLASFYRNGNEPCGIKEEV